MTANRNSSSSKKSGSKKSSLKLSNFQIIDNSIYVFKKPAVATILVFTEYVLILFSKTILSP